MTQEEEVRRAYEEATRRAFAEQAAQQQIIAKMQRKAAERQAALDSTPQQQFAIIAAIDCDGGIGKDGQLPWDYPSDLKWFKQKTYSNVCVMGKDTYLDITNRQGDIGVDSVLPNRLCFVVSTTLSQDDVKNAIVVKSLYDVQSHPANDDLTKTIFLIGGRRIFEAGLSMADVVYITAINHSYNCDVFFPTHKLTKLFNVERVFKSPDTEDLRFIEYARKR